MLKDLLSTFDCEMLAMLSVKRCEICTNTSRDQLKPEKFVFALNGLLPTAPQIAQIASLRNFYKMKTQKKLKKRWLGFI